MAASGGPGRSRRARGSEPLVALMSRVPVHTREAVNEAADALGISASQYLQGLIERDREVRARAAHNAGDHSAA